MNKIAQHPIQTVDFIKRTKQILEQYKRIKPEVNYCNTLFINVCFSLIAICKIEMTQQLEPQFKSNFPDEIVSKDKWGISPEDISIVRDGNKNIANIVEGIRDCLDHNRFEFSPRGDADCAPIEWIKFNSNKFAAKFDFIDFKRFVKKVAECTLQHLEK